MRFPGQDLQGAAGENTTSNSYTMHEDVGASGGNVEESGKGMETETAQAAEAEGESVGGTNEEEKDAMVEDGEDDAKIVQNKNYAFD